MSLYDNVLVTIRDFNSEITSVDGKHVKSGAYSFKISAPLLDHKTASKIQIFDKILLSIIAVLITITFVLAIFRNGSLVATWLCINTI